MILLVALALLNSCRTSGGIKEPVIWDCTITPDMFLFCRDSDDPDKTKTIELVEGIGYSATPPKHKAKIENHHDELHFELNQCRKR